MGSPAIFNGRRTKLLTSDGLLTSAGRTLDFDGLINYIAKSGAEVDTTGWTTFADGASLVDGTGGVATATFTRSTSSPLRGTASFLFTPGTLGDGVSYGFAIDDADKAKVLQISMDFQLSGTITEGDYQAYIYDVTNATLIQPAGYKFSGTSGTNYRLNATFQTASNSTSYRLIIWQAVSTAVTLKLDNVTVTPQVVSTGGIATDWQSYTPTGAWVANTTYTGKWRRVGDTMEIDIGVSTSGVPTSASLTVNLPSGYTIDTSKLALGTGISSLASSRGLALDSSASTGYSIGAQYSSTTAILLVYQSNASGANSVVNQASPFAWASGDTINITIAVPITSWGTSQVLSSETDTRVVALQVGGAAPAATAHQPIIWPTVLKDTHGGYNASTGLYTVSVPGFYRVTALTFGTIALTETLYASVNGNTTAGPNRPVLGVVQVANQGTSGSGVVYAIAGETISVRASGNHGVLLSLCTMSIERISGPSQIAASESVNFAATAATTSIPTTLTETTIVNPTVAVNSHGAYDSTTGLFTAPMNGVYSFSAGAQSNAAFTNTIGDVFQLSLQKNSTTPVALSAYRAQTTSSIEINIPPVLWVGRLFAGETVRVRGNSNLDSAFVCSGAYTTFFQGCRVGN